MAAVDEKFNFNFKKESLPHMIEPYQEAANGSTLEEFVSQVPYPFLIYVRSKLWDPLLLLARQKGGSSSDTAIVSYDIEAGGRSFISPVRKRQTDPNDIGIYLGRDTINDLVVPVNSISARHCRFLPPQDPASKWRIVDLGTKNGTYLREARLDQNRPYEVDSGTYLRLGGNLMTWFLLPERVWAVLRSPTQLKTMIES